jgi:hypothetical protein
MVELLFEVWRDPENNSISCFVAGENSEAERGLLSPRATLVRAFHATTHEDAMRKHHDAEGWGTYKGIPGVTDQPFTQEQALAQRAYLARRG